MLPQDAQAKMDVADTTALRQGLTSTIAIFIPSLDGGGAERAMVTLANGIATRGYRVDLVLCTPQGPYLSEVAADVRVVDLNARRVAASLPGLVRYLRREQPAVMLSALNHANVIAVLARMLVKATTQLSTRLIVSERAYFSVSRANAKTLRGRMMGAFMQEAYPRADVVTAISTGVADDLARSIGMPRSSIKVAYNPIVSATLLAQSKEDIGHPWFQTGEAPVVLAVGRLTALKDFPTLIRAFSRLRKQRMCRLVILGEGVLRPELMALVAELGLQADVDLPGFVENPFAFMRRSALFVLSSASEGFGNVLVQAMACGTPVVSTDCPSGPREILEGERWGRLVPVGDIEALTKAMAASLDDTQQPDVAQRAAEFSVERAVDEYLKLMLPAMS